MELVKQQASSKRRLKLGDIAEHLQVKKFVIRTWEKELGLAPQGGFYGAEAIELFRKIKQLVLVEKQPLAQVRATIGISVEEPVEAIAENVLSMVEPATTLAAGEMIHTAGEMEEVSACEAVVEQVDQSMVTDDGVQVCDQAQDCAAQEPVASVVEEQFVAAASYQAEEVVAELGRMAEALVAESRTIAPAELCEAMADPQGMATKPLLNEHMQQKFVMELAFFKQELLKFQQLLNT